jgi:hypothetical protein
VNTGFLLSCINNLGLAPKFNFHFFTQLRIFYGSYGISEEWFFRLCHKTLRHNHYSPEPTQEEDPR